MVTNPCPRCSRPRASLDANCASCGWTLDTPQTTQLEPRDGKSPWAFPFWIGLTLILAVVHGLTVVWSFQNVPPGLFVMEGGGDTTLLESVATLLLMTLNIPLGYLGLAIGNKPMFLLCLVANSLLWGAVGSTVFSTLARYRRWRASVGS